MNHPKFSILIITYNRRKLLKNCIQSLLEQTFQDFEAFILDRGSTPSALEIVNSFSDTRLIYVSSSQNIPLADGSNEIIKNINGEIFFHLADDDVIAKDTLMLVEKAFEKYAFINIVQIGLVGYDSHLLKKNIDPQHFSRHSLYNFFDNSHYIVNFIEGKDIEQAEWSKFGIGIEFNIPFTRPHPSSLFFKSSYLKSLFNIQNGVFLKPIWDVGWSGLVYKSKVLYLNLPLSIITEKHEQRESTTQRLRWKDEMKNIQYLPVKTPCILSCFINTALQAIYNLKLDKDSKVFLRPSFYIELCKIVLPDSPKTLSTLKDFIKIMPYLIKNIILHPICFIITTKEGFLNTALFKLIKNPLLFDNLILQPILKPLKKRLGRKKSFEKDFLLEEENNIIKYKYFIEKLFSDRYEKALDAINKV